MSFLPIINYLNDRFVDTWMWKLLQFRGVYRHLSRGSLTFFYGGEGFRLAHKAPPSPAPCTCPFNNALKWHVFRLPSKQINLMQLIGFVLNILILFQEIWVFPVVCMYTFLSKCNIKPTDQKILKIENLSNILLQALKNCMHAWLDLICIISNAWFS